MPPASAGRVGLVWLRRDLRLCDNPALHSAATECSAVVLVYVHAPGEDAPWSPGAASRWWLHGSLEALGASLAPLGRSLCLRVGNSAAELLAVAGEVGATCVYWNRCYEPAAASRDRAVERALEEAGLESRSHGAALLLEPGQVTTGQGGPFRVFTPFWRACQARLGSLPPPLPAPARLPRPQRPATSLALGALGLLPRTGWDASLARTWSPGEHSALGALERFCDTAVAGYEERRNLPAVAGTSRLSPHLHFGEIGPRQCLAAVTEVTSRTPAAGRGAERFLSEIGWREFAHHLLWHFPHTHSAPLDARFDAFPWATDAVALDAWQRGRTGIPIVDAGMRELWATGWMHNRVRMIVASLLTKNLRLHWLEGARWFWDTLVDADLASNTLGWQWTAGCGADAAPYVRVFNPVLQTERFDPARSYIRQWLPELGALPDEWVHRPWEAPDSALAAAGLRLGRDYPRPIVDLAASRRAALEAYDAIRAPRPGR